ncbi:RDD family protein [Arthrobacter sp. NPDC055138]
MTRPRTGAGFRRRLLALLLDYLVILTWMAVLALLSLLWRGVFGDFPDTLAVLGPLGSQTLFFFLLTFVVGVYLYRTEAGPRHATWGKRRMGLTVAALNGTAPSRKQILIRTVVKLLPWECAHIFVWQMMWFYYLHGYQAMPPTWIFIGQQAATAAAVAYIAMVLVTGRGPHDRAAGTVVV